MNRIDAVITKIERIPNISIVSFDVSGQSLQMMALELDETLKEGVRVVLGVKSTAVSLAKAPTGMLSISNQLASRVVGVNNGELLSSIRLSFKGSPIESIITRNSSLRMGIKEGDELVALIKASELFIAKVKR